ncbi:MAG TPA: peptide-methionine (S)-S-oxide reductase MsrA [Edaphocola sp.]|nr:peptide-methionine (S)-S-oxide reductase MsrA [Edaphocola sp.]
MKFIQNYWLLILGIILLPCSDTKISSSDNLILNIMQQESNNKKVENVTKNKTIDTAIFAGGCFWCVEGQFKLLEGVINVKSGYIGGKVPNPSYELVCTGTTQHAEAARIEFDPEKISYDELLAAFFMAHDPTQLNRQGNDVGTQYRSAIFPINEEQKNLASFYIKKLNEEKVYSNPIVTSIEWGHKFYEAENYHDDYYSRNPDKPYCQIVVKPKVEHFRKVFADKLKENAK